MTELLSYIPTGFGVPHMIAVALIFGLWAFYTQILKVIGRGSLNSQLHAVRLRWLQTHQGVARDQRVIDAIMLGHISSSISYFGSATLIVLAGLVGTLANVTHLFALTRGLAFVDQTMTTDLFTLYFFLLTLMMALCFFSFTYALRKMAYVLAMLGGLEATPVNSPNSMLMGEQTAVVLTESVRSINSGIRGFYYAIAALFLFAGPYVAISATLLITALLYYRQLFSPTARAIARYVDALKGTK
jgi:uncharacterized membrane protein